MTHSMTSKGFNLHNLQLRTFESTRSHQYTGHANSEICPVGQANMGLHLSNWMRDCAENLYFTTSIFRNKSGKCNLSFSLEVEADAAEDPLWNEEINLFLDQYSPNHFWNRDLTIKKEWAFLNILKIETTSARQSPRDRNSCHTLINLLNTTSSPIAIQSLYHLQWHQPKRGPKPPIFFFDPGMESSHVPSVRPPPSRKIDHTLLVYSDSPLGSFIKSSIVRAIYGEIQGRPAWRKSFKPTDSIQLQAAKAIFTDPEYKKDRLRIDVREFQYMMTGNLHLSEEESERFRYW